ncbi:MAG: hypothetical protein KDC98_18030 [Planctomycetes bacterium]|nr:hypothetical protein [Planctomycetota bacterium]
MPAVLARCHSVCGWIAFRLGLRSRARRHFEHVLRLRGDDFSAYVHLGRIAYDAGDYAGWRREFEHARRAHPGRFARLRHPFELFEPRLAGTSFDDAGERATWQSMRPFNTGTRQRIGGPRQDSTRRDLGGRDIGRHDLADDEIGTDEPPAGIEGLEDGIGAGSLFDVARHESEAMSPLDDSADRDDCRNEDERSRLRHMGPIHRTEWMTCDFDELARRLTS